MKKKIAELINIIFGFRKFLLMLILYLVGIVFRVNDLISGSDMVKLFESTTIAFMGANGIEHIVSTVRDYASMKKAPEVIIPTEESDREAAAAEKKNG